MHKLVLISGIATLIILGLVVYMWPSDSSNPSDTNTPSTSFPPDTGPSDEPASDITIATYEGQEIVVRNFLEDSTVVADTQNSGFYHLGNHFPDEEISSEPYPPYTITYIESTQYFNIGLYKEPIGTVRTQAESYLQSQLGISDEEMCKLRYTVSVPVDVNKYYGGTNLGFSFCPGSVSL